MIYVLSTGLALISLGLGFVCWKSPECRLTLPRLRWLGVLLGVPCMIWCGWHGCMMLEGPLATFHPWVWGLVPVTCILSYFFLDYLFARACGGIMILLANALVHYAFAEEIAWRPVYSLVCLLLGVCGLFGVGTPWKMRDLFELCHRNHRASCVISGAFWVASAVLLILPLF